MSSQKRKPKEAGRMGRLAASTVLLSLIQIAV